jgi:eukaryotic-like serine/threonine-protein kinase
MRISMIRAGIPLSMAALLTFGAAAEDREDRAQYRGGAARTGSYDVRPMRAFGGLQWRFMTGGAVRSTPAVADEAVFVGSADGYLYAIDRWTGDERWRYDAGAAVTSSPAVTDRAVFITARDNAIHAVDRRTGERLWRAATGPDAPWAWGHESADLWTSSPLAVDGLVVAGSGDGAVHALDAASGRLRWRTETGGRVRSSPATGNGRVYVGSMDGSLHVLDLRTGRRLGEGRTAGSDLFSGDYGFDRRSIQSTPAVTESGVFVGSKDGFLYAFALDGRPRWSFDHEVSWILGGPAVGGGHVYAGSSDGRFVHAVRTDAPVEAWRHATSAPVWTSPAYARDVLSLGDSGGTVTALDAATGALLWAQRVAGPVRSSPVPGDDALYFGSDDGAVYALRGAPTPLRRAVFHDSAVERLSYFAASGALTDYLVGAGYERLDSARLGAWLRARTADRAPSVVVFSHDRLPADLLPGADGRSPLTSYLEAAGKVVWTGMPPLLRRVDAEGNAPALIDTGWDATTTFLGVDHGPAIFDPFTARPTAAGRRWGLSGWWLTRWAARPGPGVTALALDEAGAAPMWVRSWGGPPGTGFVRIWAERAAPPDPGLIQGAAEYRPAPDTAGQGAAAGPPGGR